MMRQDGEMKVLVTYPGGSAIVHVFQKGSPHPKGLDSVIVKSEGGIGREERQAIQDDAINFVRGQTTKFSCEEFHEEKQDAGNAETSGEVVGSTGSDQVASESAPSNPSASNEIGTPPQGEEKPSVGEGTGV